jgi:hypothetical protein
LKHNGKVVLLTSLIVCLILGTLVAGCGGAKSQVYTASFGKIKVTTAVPAETNSTTSAIRNIDNYFESNVDSLAAPPTITLASYKVDNGSSRPTLCDDYSFNLTFEPGQATFSLSTKEQLGKQLKNLSILQYRALLNQGTPVLKRLQDTNEVKPGHNATAYYFFPTLDKSGVKRIIVTSKETHQTKVMKKQ